MTSAFTHKKNKMNAKELMQPRYKIIADAPLLKNKVGETIVCNEPHGRIALNFFFSGVAEIAPDTYPHIFKKLKWFEERKKEEMPKKVICKAIPNDTEIMEIEEWDMEIMVGWTNKEKRECCSLLSFNYEYGYFPVD